MREIWATAIAEIRALGWQCILHGPEFWLAFAGLCCAGAAAILVSCIAFAAEERRNKDDDDSD